MHAALRVIRRVPGAGFADAVSAQAVVEPLEGLDEGRRGRDRRAEHGLHAEQAPAQAVAFGNQRLAFGGAQIGNRVAFAMLVDPPRYSAQAATTRATRSSGRPAAISRLAVGTMNLENFDEAVEQTRSSWSAMARLAKRSTRLSL